MACSLIERIFAMSRFFTYALAPIAVCYALVSMVSMSAADQSAARGAKSGQVCVVNASCKRCLPDSGCNLIDGSTPDRSCDCGVLGFSGCSNVGPLKTCVYAIGSCTAAAGLNDCGPAKQIDGGPAPILGPDGIWFCNPTGTCFLNPATPVVCNSCGAF